MDTTKIFESQPWLNNSLQNRRGIVRLASMGTREENMVVTWSIIDDYLTLSATWQEIADAMASGKNVVCLDEVENVVYGAYPIICLVYDPYGAGNKYSVKIQMDSARTFTCATASAKPSYEM